jgi:hypothetical protein
MRREVNRLRKIQRTTIDELAPIGHELTEAHLRLASGGLAVAPTYRDGIIVDSCTDMIPPYRY